MKRIALAAIAALLIFSSSNRARAQDDITTGSLQNRHYISWGDKSVLIYGSALNTDEFFGIQVNSSDMVRVNTTGVGIGTTSPTNTLSVAGNANVTGTLAVSGVTTLSGAIQAGVQLGLTPQTTNQIAVLVPISTGTLTVVSTLNPNGTVLSYGTCISSGIMAGAWVWPSTSSTASIRVCN